jgi:hypothetical protein
VNSHQTIVSISHDLPFADDVEQLRARFRRHLARLRVALVYTGDRHASLRREWLTSNTIAHEAYQYTVESASGLPEFVMGAQIVIFSGNDSLRLKRIFRECRSYLTRAVVICITNKMSPQNRASLLTAGFDDVIDITKADADEFVARCSAMHLRAEAAYQTHILKLESELKLNAIADESKLNRRHKTILLNLLSSKNNTVSYDVLRDILSVTHEPISDIQMKVLVCQTRKALRPGVQIASLAWLRLPGDAYKLLLNDDFDNPQAPNEDAASKGASA